MRQHKRAGGLVHISSCVLVLPVEQHLVNRKSSTGKAGSLRSTRCWEWIAHRWRSQTAVHDPIRCGPYRCQMV